MSIPPDDCAILVTYDPEKEPPFQLERIRSNGAYASSVHFDLDGSLRFYLPTGKSRHRFALSFRLPPDDASGGFAGIKVWQKDEPEPESFILSGRGYTQQLPVDLPFDLHVYFTSPDDADKATVLSIGNLCQETATYRYCLAIYKDKERSKHDVTADDPRIYNNGDPGDGGKGPGCLFGWLRLLWR